MSTFDVEIAPLVAMASVTGTTGAAVANRGFLAITRTGPGVYTLDYELATGAAGGYAAAELNTQLTVGGATSGIITREYTSATQLTVRTFDAAASASDRDFDVTVRRLANHEP
jgi:hypothetical protein